MSPILRRSKRLAPRARGRSRRLHRNRRAEAIAGEVFAQVDKLLTDADELRTQAVEHLQAGERADALRKLGTCFTSWTHTQSSLQQVARRLRIDLEQMTLSDGASLQSWLEAFSAQLTGIRTALELRDYSQLADILAYEAHDASAGVSREAIGEISKTLR